MKLTFRKCEVKNLTELESLVADNAEAIEPGLQIIATGVNLGRSSIELAGLDASRRPVLVAVGLTADDAMIFKMVEAYAWCLEYPESLRRLARGDGPGEWPPRVAFVAERMLESFLRKIRLLKFPRVDCFEYSYVEVNGSTGFYLDPVDWTRSASAPPAAGATESGPRPVPADAEPRPLEERGERSGPWANGHRAPLSRLGAPDRSELLGGLSEGARRDVDGAEAPATPALDIETAAPAGPADEPATDSARPALDEIDLGLTRELTPTWRKFLDKLTSGFEARPAPPVEEVGPPEPAASVPAAVPSPAAVEPPAPVGDEIEAGAPALPVSPSPRDGRDPRRPAADDKQSLLLEGLKLPSNGELAPQWRKFLDRPSAFDEGKTGVVREYLQREFPMSTVYDFHDFQRNAQVFQLQDNHGKVMQLAALTADFFDEHKEPGVRAWIEKHKLAQALRQAGQAGVLVNKDGLQVDNR